MHKVCNAAVKDSWFFLSKAQWIVLQYQIPASLVEFSEVIFDIILNEVLDTKIATDSMRNDTPYIYSSEMSHCGNV